MGLGTLYGNIIQTIFRDKAWVLGHERMLKTTVLKFNTVEIVLIIADM